GHRITVSNTAGKDSPRGESDITRWVFTQTQQVAGKEGVSVLSFAISTDTQGGYTLATKRSGPEDNTWIKEREISISSVNAFVESGLTDTKLPETDLKTET